MSKYTLIIAAVLIVGLNVAATESRAASQESAENQNSQDQVFTSEYLGRINTQAQLEQSQSEQDQARHQKFLDNAMKFRR